MADDADLAPWPRPDNRILYPTGRVMKKLLIFLTFVLGLTAIMALLISSSQDDLDRLDIDGEFDPDDF